VAKSVESKGVMTPAASPLDKSADTKLDLHPFVRNRWSPRAFSAQSVSPADLELLLEAARWAPSCSNEQPWRFIVARKEDAASFAKILSVLDEGNQIWTKHAPVLMLTNAKKTFGTTGKPNRWAPHDTGLALGNLIVQASAIGIFVHPMAGFDAEKARSVFHIPDDFEPMAAVAIGYLGDPNSLPEKLRLRELARRTRKPLNEVAFGTDWDEALKLTAER
jgi:nitroreductase